MDKFMLARLVGALVYIIGCILFFVGVMTDHWAHSDNISWGLWQYCINTTSQFQNQSNYLNLTFTSTTILTSSDQEKEDKEEDISCKHFGLSQVPGNLHVVRALTVLGSIAVAYSIFSGRVLRLRIIHEDTFLSTHRGEIAAIIGAAIGIAVVLFFRSSYKSYDMEFDDDHVIDDSDTRHLDWSLWSLHNGSIMIIVGAIFMMAPTIKDHFCSSRSERRECFHLSPDAFKNDPLGACYRCLMCKQQQRPQTTPVYTDREVEVPAVTLEINSFDAPSADTESHTNVFTTDIDLRNTSRNISRRSLSLNDDASFADPAPRYEDLPPREVEDVPPPPSYDEVVTGQYSISHIPESSAFSPASYQPPSGMRAAHHIDLPPPSYDESRV